MTNKLVTMMEDIKPRVKNNVGGTELSSMRKPKTPAPSEPMLTGLSDKADQASAFGLNLP